MKRIIFYLFLIGVSLVTTSSNGQTVDTGREVMRGTLDFSATALYLATHPEPFVMRQPENEEDDEVPRRLPETDSTYIHLRPATTGIFSPLMLLPPSPDPTDTFQSTYDPGTSIPPDTHGAVDGNYCVTTINTTVKIQNRTGGAVSSVTLNAFWTSVLPGGGSFDPRVHYDPYTNRWIIVAVADAFDPASSILIAVSQTSNPTGAWWTYKILADGTGVDWFDYPDVGFNDKWITVSGNMFSNTGGPYGGAKVFVFDKASLLSGAGAPYTSFLRTSSSTICPALTYDPTLKNMFMVESWNGYAGQMRLWKISGNVGAETMTSVGFPTSAARWQNSSFTFSGTSGADFAPQAGTANLVQTNDDRVTQCVFMNNRLWFAHNAFLPYSTSVNPTRCSVQWWEIDTLANPIQIGRIDDPTNTNFYVFPCITVNTSNDALIGFSTFSGTTYPSAAYAMRYHTDPIDSIRPVHVYRHGQASYYKTFTGTKNRWGDYSGTALDPVNQLDFWTIQEASGSPANRWDTWWAHVKICNTAAITGPTALCIGDVATMSNTTPGGTWSSSNTGVATIGSLTGIVNAAGAGTTVISYIDATACTVTATLTVNALPSVFAVTGGGSFCAGGTGVSVGLSSSSVGVNYQLFNGGSPVGGPVAGTTLALNFGLMTAAGTYTVVATNATAGCSRNMSGSAVVTVNSAPLVYAVTGGGAYCSGGPGVHIGVANSNVGISYQLYLGGTPVGSPLAGTGSSIDFGFITGAGTYTVVATNTTTACTSNMSGSATVTTASAPTAAIGAAGPTGFCTGGSVVLNAVTGVGYTFQWENGGTPISGATNFSYTANASGSYRVVVTDMGCSATSTPIVVTVSAVPSAVITPAGPTTFCTGGNVVLNASTGIGYTYQWKLGGTDITGETNSSHTATLAGNYTVVVNNSGCSNTSGITTVVITPGPGSSITPAGPTSFCSGGSVVLNGTPGGGLSYQWQLGGTPISGATNSSLTATAGGNYTLITTFGTCVVTSPVTTITILPATVAPITGLSNVCVGQNITLSDTDPGGTWTSSAPLIATVSTGGVVSGVAAGTVTITYAAVTACGPASTTTTITVDALPSVAAITGSTSVCTGGTTTLANATPSGVWSSGSPSVASIGATTGIVNGLAAGTSAVSYSVTNVAGCTAHAVVTFSVTSPVVAVITPSGPTTFCTGASVTLSAPTGTGLSYQWQLGGVNIAGAVSPSLTTITSGSYTVIITAGGGCNATSPAVVVTVNPSPIVVPSVSIAATPGTTLCLVSSPVSYTATPVNGGSFPFFQWSVNGVPVASGTSYSYTPASGDIVACQLTSSDVCAFPVSVASSLTMTISALETPAVSISVSPNDSVCKGTAVTYSAVPVFGGSAPAYLWTLNGTSIATGPTYTYVPNSGDMVMCTLTSNYPCLATITAVSAPFMEYVKNPVVNTISISVSQTLVSSGSFVTFTAVAPNAGPSPLYQWYINGIAVPGANSATFVTDALLDGQTVTCAVTSNEDCVSPKSVMSSGIKMSVAPTGITAVHNENNFTLLPNPNKGEFTVNGILTNRSNELVDIIVTNVVGQTVYSKKITASNGKIAEPIKLASSVANGTYIVTVTAGEDHVVFHVVVNR